MADTTKEPLGLEEHNELMDTILAHEYPPADDDLHIKTKGDHKFRIPKQLYVNFRAFVETIEENPALLNGDRILSIPGIGYKPMYCLIDLVKILVYDEYTEQLTQQGVFEVYFKYLWRRTIEGTALSEYTMVADAAKLFRVEKLIEPITHFFLDRLMETTTSEEYYECMIRIGYPRDRSLLCEVVDTIREMYPVQN